MVNIQEITAADTYLVRHPVLRMGKAVESCRFDGDDLETTHHFGLYLNAELVCILSLFKSNNSFFGETKQYQIRGMAILQPHQKRGFGKSLIIFAEKFAKRENIDLIWFNARIEAVGFYEKMGFQIIGKPFEIPDVGTHVIMFKKM